MPDVSFQITGASAMQFAAAPTIALNLQIASEGFESIQNILLRCQVQIEATHRAHSDKTHPSLLDLLGPAHRWGQTLRPLLWTHVNLIVQSFGQETSVELPLPCSFDMSLATTKYLYGLNEGDIPLNVLFSGTIFYRQPQGLQIMQIPWTKEARFRLPLNVWKDMMDHYYPGVVWLNLGREEFDRLMEFKLKSGLATWNQLIASLLHGAGEEVAK